MDNDVETSIVLPVNVINTLTCSECLNYLSVKPIMISAGNKILCGRCTNKYQNRYRLTYSLYNYLAENCIFNCVNNYDGCDALLRLNDTIEHESTCCFNRTHECHLCSYKGNACQIKNHIEIKHSSNVINDGIYHLPTEIVSTDEVLFYFTQNILVKIDLQIDKDKLKVSAFLINPAQNNSGVFYSLKFHNPDWKNKYLFEHIQFSNIDSDLLEKGFEIKLYDLVRLFPSPHILMTIVINCDENILNQKYAQLKIAHKKQEDNIKKEREKLVLEKGTLNKPYNILKKIIDLYMRSTITCQNCGKEVHEKYDILICPQAHIGCLKCTKDYCALCTNCCKWVSLKELLKGLELQCDWTNCERKTHAWEFMQHKQLCINRQFKCPSPGCSFYGVKGELMNHWHSKVDLHIGGTIDFNGRETLEIYWVTDYLNELLHVTVDVNGFYIDVIVSEKFAINPNNYLLELHHIGDDYCYKPCGFLVQYSNYKAYYNYMSTKSEFRLVFLKKII